MSEIFLKEMGFLTEPAVEYDPYHVISNKRKDVKRKPFKHEEVVGLAEAAHWNDYPKSNPKGTNREEYFDPSVRDITSPMPDISDVVMAATDVNPLANWSNRDSK